MSGIYIAIFFALIQPEHELFRLYGGSTMAECRAFVADLYERHAKVVDAPRSYGGRCVRLNGGRS